MSVTPSSFQHRKYETFGSVSGGIMPSHRQSCPGLAVDPAIEFSLSNRGKSSAVASVSAFATPPGGTVTRAGLRLQANALCLERRWRPKIARREGVESLVWSTSSLGGFGMTDHALQTGY